MPLRGVILGFVFIAACERPHFDRGAAPVHAALPPGMKSTSAKDCLPCHRSDYEDWRASMHSRAFTDPVFQEAFRLEAAAMCVNCHAPLEDQAFPRDSVNSGAVDLSAPANPLREEGINCAACHVRDGTILSSRPASISSPHPVRVDRRLASAEFCAGCHQFNFPYDDPQVTVHYGFEPMQNTYEEWKQSAAAGEGIGCTNCHMSSSDHLLRGPHTPGWLERRVTVSAREAVSASGETTVETHITVAGIGHRFPTGDLFRHLTLQISAQGRVIDSVEFGRLVADRPDGRAPGGIYKWVARDTSLAPGRSPVIEKTVVTQIRRGEAGGPYEYRLTYFFQSEEIRKNSRLAPALHLKILAAGSVLAARTQALPDAKNEVEGRERIAR